MQIAELLGFGKARDNGLGRDHPADPQARERDLRIAAQKDGIARFVEFFERRERLALIAEFAVDIVFDEYNGVALGEFDETFAAVERESSAGRILKARSHDEHDRMVLFDCFL